MRASGMAAVVGFVVLAGCQDGGGQTAGDEAVNVEMLAPAASPGSAGQTPPPTPPGAPTAPITTPRIAYVYRYGLELPADRAPGLMARHEQACAAAGAATCQVIGSESTRIGRDDLTARLEIRATPAYIARFRAAIAGEARAAGGRVASAATESEDLTRALIDTEARLRAQITLRDRLQQLLATRSGPLEQLLQVERELARVQGEVDALQSGLEVMRARVATSRLQIEYSSAAQLASDSAFRPAVDALRGSLGVFMTTVAALITVLAILLPIALIATPLILWVRRRRRAGRLAAGKSETTS